MAKDKELVEKSIMELDIVRTQSDSFFVNAAIVSILNFLGLVACQGYDK